MKEIGYKAESTIEQDNTSSIKLESNGRSSAGKRSRHIDIRYFYVTDQIKQGLVKVKYRPTDDMDSDYLSKPLQGKKFRKHRITIMNLPGEDASDVEAGDSSLSTTKTTKTDRSAKNSVINMITCTVAKPETVTPRLGNLRMLNTENARGDVWSLC